MSRERRSTEFFDATSTAKAQGAKFNFEEGNGTKLSALGQWATGSRGAIVEALETALEPLHRAVFGRPGKLMERRAALGDYCGFPESMTPIMKSKVVSWKKDQLKALVQTLGIDAHVSIPVGDLAEAVLKFLQHPTEKKSAPKAKAEPKAATPKTATTEPKERPPKRPAAESAEDQPVAKKAKTEVTPAAATSTKVVRRSASALPHDDTIRVALYRRVLAMTGEERNNIGVKSLRAEIEKQHSLPEGALKEKTDLIRETALLCVNAVREAETRGAALALGTAEPPTKDVAPEAAPATPEKETAGEEENGAPTETTNDDAPTEEAPAAEE